MAYIAKIKDTSGVTGPVGSALYGTCSTAACTAAKVVILSDFDTLIVGVTVHVLMLNSNTADNPTLNINSTGAKSIIRKGATTTAAGTAAGTDTTTAWVAGSIVSFTYLTYTPSGGSATGVWVMNDKQNAKQISVGSASAGTAITVKQWSFEDVSCSLVTKTDGVAASLTYNNESSLTYSGVTIPNVTTAGTATTATISSGTLTFTKGTDTVLGTALEASKITAPASGTTWSTITAWTTNTPTAITITSKTASKATAISDIIVPNISVSNTTVLAPDI